jgi:hypothetical protein
MIDGVASGDFEKCDSTRVSLLENCSSARNRQRTQESRVMGEENMLLFLSASRTCPFDMILQRNLVQQLGNRSGETIGYEPYAGIAMKP